MERHECTGQRSSHVQVRDLLGLFSLLNYWSLITAVGSDSVLLVDSCNISYDITNNIYCIIKKRLPMEGYVINHSTSGPPSSNTVSFIHWPIHPSLTHPSLTHPPLTHPPLTHSCIDSRIDLFQAGRSYGGTPGRVGYSWVTWLRSRLHPRSKNSCWHVCTDSAILRWLVW